MNNTSSNTLKKAFELSAEARVVLKQLNIQDIDFPTLNDLANGLVVDTSELGEHISIQRPSIESAFFSTMVYGFLQKNGLVRAFETFKMNDNEIRKCFSGERMQTDYNQDLELLERKYNVIANIVNSASNYRIGDKVWYLEESGEKCSAVLQSYPFSNGITNYVSLELNGKLLENVPLEKISHRY